MSFLRSLGLAWIVGAVLVFLSPPHDHTEQALFRLIIAWVMTALGVFLLGAWAVLRWIRVRRKPIAKR